MTNKILFSVVLLAGVTRGTSQPVITNQPQSLTDIAGTTAIFSVGATGTEPLSYQWQHYFTWLQDEINAPLTLSNVQSVAGVNYLLERSTNLLGSAPVFTPVASGIPGRDGTTSYFDTNPVGTGPVFYRVGVGN